MKAKLQGKQEKINSGNWVSTIHLQSESKEEKRVLKELHLKNPFGHSVMSDDGWVTLDFSDKE